MNLLCPRCQETISIADQFAGQLMKCPLCSGTFTAPSLAVAVAPPLAVPDLPPAAKPESKTPDGNDNADVKPRPIEKPIHDDYARQATIWISPRVIPWIGPPALTLILVLTFFTWLKAIDPTTHVVTSRNAWGLAFLHPINALSIFYLLFLALGVVFGLIALVAPKATIRLPTMLRQVLPWSSGILLAAVTMGLVFLVLQWSVGFAQETSAYELPRNTMRTIALRSCILLHVVAVVSFALEFWLTIRKAKPMPRVTIDW